MKKGNGKGFTLENYGKKSAFASFLPGISGRKGIPVWCCYVNRGQAVVSFGAEDKDHSIMEFYPAHQAYQNVKLTGFRTFLRVDGKYAEPFGDTDVPHTMTIEKNSLRIQESNPDTAIDTAVCYYTLPMESVGALVRKVTFTNKTDHAAELEVLDGMPALVPYGVGTDSLKKMGQTIKAWMQVEYAAEEVPCFRARVSVEDTAVVTEVSGCNFSMAVNDRGERLRVVVDPETVFAYDNSLQRAVSFQKKGLEGVFDGRQALSNQYPCSFFGEKRLLSPGESMTLYEMTGQVEEREILERFLKRTVTPEYFEKKAQEAEALAEDLCHVIETNTSDADFDEYCSRTYMDNALRGGYPIKLPDNRIFYLYSRKHGDLERDYNYFHMLPEYFSQGNGNFRDINQNRRMDNFFTPYVGRENIRKFYSMIQLDGYNPLDVKEVTYTLDEESVEEIFDALSQEQKEELMVHLTDSFTPGGFYRKLEELEIADEDRQDTFFAEVMERAAENLNADFGEGYWCDHWTYNLDLVENYLAVYPEQQTELLMEEAYTYFCSQIPILPRTKRYVKTEDGVRQYRFLEEEAARRDGEKLVRVNFGLGDVLKVSLLEKLLVLCATKYAALDSYGMGVEMEGGKPGWYDALNGLPGLFGSSMAETYELERLLTFVKKALPACPPEFPVTKEVAEYLQSMDVVTLLYRNEIGSRDELLEFWNVRNDAKETYEDKTFYGISGEKVTLEKEKVKEIVENLLATVQTGIKKALRLNGREVPTYFAYEVERYEETKHGIVPQHFELIRMPLFLEGTVHLLKLSAPFAEKKALYKAVRNSDLYDKRLRMYKVNASLKDASYELGRAKAFTPGWLENGSVWVQMEYKYLLELLKMGAYREYLEDFENAAIPFQNPARYGRSIYENSSFIASSENPNENLWGKGFVARLSGTTVEFLEMWKIMMFGKDTFRVEDGQLSLRFSPLLPKRLIGEEGRVEAMFMGTTRVVYHLPEKKDYVPGEYRICRICMEYADGSTYQTTSPVLGNLAAHDVRSGKVERIEIEMENGYPQT